MFYIVHKESPSVKLTLAAFVSKLLFLILLSLVSSEPCFVFCVLADVGKSRDCNGISELPLIQLISPYKISSIIV